MIGKLKRKFTILATISMFCLMTILLLIMNIVNYSSVVAESDTVLDILCELNTPMFDSVNTSDETGIPQKPDIKIEDFVPHGMSPEIPYESRYFTVQIAADGTMLEPDFSRIVSVDNDSAEGYIKEAIESSKSRGFIGQFRYDKMVDGTVTKIVFLDCGRKLDAFYSFFSISVGVGLFGCLLVFIVFLFAAGKIVKPIAESYEKQKRFISDAGHEIKTPLTIINANVDLLECDGETEELGEIRAQVRRLTELTNNLVLLSKMEESEHQLQKIELPVSDIVSETASSFQAPAMSKNVEFTVQVQPQLSINGSPNAIRQLVTILLENAVKYAPEGGIVTLELTAIKKTVALSVFNTTETQIHESDLPYVFERFYRTDSSRNSATGGHGIGLSVAKAITEAHNGTITAETKNGYDFRITVTIPQ